MRDEVDDAREFADTKKTHAWSWGSHKVEEVKEEARQRASESGRQDEL